MNPVQRPREEHDPSAPSSRTPSQESGSTAARTARQEHDDRPRYGIRVDPASAEGAASSRGTGTPAPGAGHDSARQNAHPSTHGDAAAQGAGTASGPGVGDDAAARSAAAVAARRMGRGLSFTVVMLGLLSGLALVATGLWIGWVVGATVVVLGVLGYAVVQTRSLPVFQDPVEPARASWSKLWLIPVALLAAGLGCLGMAFVVPGWLGPSVPADLLDDYVLAFVVGGMTMVVGAGLGFGLVATARFTRPDEDDAPLRPTDYAERLGPRRGGGTHYDSDWIKHDPRQ
ncbi:hypothetical protein [Kocuria sp.]|uniref:hypothetical protein n=1 Tax=Kocuria sp. TaxID=1871328 RepID=UPI0026DB5C97|nr:hypothetical protein [Kocuria sp.]MDO4918188.1 hypothetical protein [Kocuria sp.]